MGVQLALNACSNGGLTVNGVYDARTAAAVKWMQGTVGITTDAIYGPQTAAKAIQWPVRDEDGLVFDCIRTDSRILILDRG